MTAVRAIVFPLGAVFGILFAMVFSSYPGGNPKVVNGLIVAFILGLAFASPVCWYLAVRGKSGDRWTVAYILAWTCFFAGGSLLTLIF